MVSWHRRRRSPRRERAHSLPTRKSEAGSRALPLPGFAIDVLKAWRQLPFLGQQKMIFSSTAGTFRDPNNKRWRQVRVELGAGTVTTHGFRKSLATLIDDECLSARIGADHLGHSNVSMTQDWYTHEPGPGSHPGGRHAGPRCRYERRISVDSTKAILKTGLWRRATGT
jgi:integrase